MALEDQGRRSWMHLCGGPSRMALSVGVVWLVVWMTTGTGWGEPSRMFAAPGVIGAADTKGADASDVPLESDAGLAPEVTLDLGDGVSLKLVLIRPGRFQMGVPAGEARGRDDQPARRVTVAKPFYLAATELTNAQYHALAGEWAPYGKTRLSYPAMGMSFAMAWDFCCKASDRTGRAIRLPTEAEWEYACRAGTTTAYCTGASEVDARKAGWFRAGPDAKTVTWPQMVAQREPNAWGFYDMHGNVQEWCVETRDARPAEADAREPGRETHTPKVLRGGAWEDSGANCRSASRRPWKYSDGWALDSAGIRVAMDPGPLKPPKLPPEPEPVPPAPAVAPDTEEARALAETEAFVKDGGNVTKLLAPWGRTRLGDAISKGQAKVVRYLLEHGASASSAPPQGSIPLHIAARANKPEIVEILIEYGANVDSRDGRSRATALHATTDSQSYEAAKLLLEKGADPDIQNNVGRTPIYVAIAFKNAKMVALFVNAGCDLTTIRDYDHQSPLDYARKEGGPEVMAIIEKTVKSKGVGKRHTSVKEAQP